LGPAVGRMTLMLTSWLARLPLIASLVARPSGRPEVRMRRASSLILGLTVLALAGPGVAQSPEPQVSAFSPQGTVKQVRKAQGHFSVPMVPLGDPRLTDPFDVARDGRILDTVTFVVRGARLTPADDRDLSP